MADDKPFDRNALALSYGPSFEIPQRDSESNDMYRERLAGELREKGHIIEAHEVYSGRRYDDPAQNKSGTMMGIMGAVAQELVGKSYSPHDSQRQIGDDIAAGAVVQKGRTIEDDIAMVFGILGVKAGMDFLDAQHKH